MPLTEAVRACPEHRWSRSLRGRTPPRSMRRAARCRRSTFHRSCLPACEVVHPQGAVVLVLTELLMGGGGPRTFPQPLLQSLELGVRQTSLLALPHELGIPTLLGCGYLDLLDGVPDDHYGLSDGQFVGLVGISCCRHLLSSNKVPTGPIVLLDSLKLSQWSRTPL